MHKNDSVGGSKLPQRTGLTVDYNQDSNLLILSSDASERNIAYPTSEQTFLFNLWTSFENIQDLIYDQSSSEYQMFEVINPILFNIWIKTGRHY